METAIICTLIPGVSSIIVALIASFVPFILNKKWSKKGDNQSDSKTESLVNDGITVGVLRKESKMQSDSEYQNNKPLRKKYYIMVIGLLVIGLLLTGIAIYLIYTQPTNVNITFPANAANVGMWEWVSGTSQNIPKGQELWIVVRVDGLYFLHKVDTINPDGTWRHKVQIGQENEGGKNFDVIAVLANSTAQITAQIWLKNQYSPNHDLRELPAGMTPYSTITVTRTLEKSFDKPSNLEKPSSEPSVIITYPSKDDYVNIREWVSGTAHNIPAGYKLWIVVRWDSLYFPMLDGVQIRPDGTWMYDTSIGKQDDAGKNFEIIAVLADGSAQAKVNEWYQRHSDLHRLPDGMTPYSTVTVTRK